MLSVRRGLTGLLMTILLGGAATELFSQTRWHQMDVGPFFSATFTQ